MPLTHFLYRCPECGHDPLEGEGDEASCPACGVQYTRGGEGGMIRRKGVHGTEELFGHLLGIRIGPEEPQEGSSGVRRVRVQLRRAQEKEEPVRFRGEVVGFAEKLQEVEEGFLELSREALVFRETPGQGPPRDQWALEDIRAVQTTSKALQISPITGGVVQFRFPEDSPKRWEELLHSRIQDRFSLTGRGTILEFQPRIVTEEERRLSPRVSGKKRRRIPSGQAVAREAREAGTWHMGWYGILRQILRALLALGTRSRVQGLENVPRRGPYVLVANHQSLLDPIAVQVACPRPIHTLTKSTQFGQGFFRFLLPRLNAIPTRRYCIEPQAVRVMLRRLAEGRGVGIYPEGERSWDGVLQPFRRGTVRFLLRAGVPVIPVGISGAYDVWPRWSRRIRRRSVSVTFGPPMDWPTLDTRWEAEAAVEKAAQELREALAALGAWTEEGRR